MNFWIRFFIVENFLFVLFFIWYCFYGDFQDMPVEVLAAGDQQQRVISLRQASGVHGDTVERPRVGNGLSPKSNLRVYKQLIKESHANASIGHGLSPFFLSELHHFLCVVAYAV